MPYGTARSTLLSVLVATAVALVGACEAAGPLRPDAARTTSVSAPAPGLEAGRAVFMTRNVYFGADVTPLLDPTLPPERIPAVGARVWKQVVSNDFQGRAAALAAEVDRYRPHAIGLQEVALYRMEKPADPTSAATDPLLDFRTIFLAALADRGLDYRVAAVSRNFDVELPILDPTSPTSLTDVRMTDHDVVLVRGDLAWRNPATDHYAFNLQVPLAGTLVEIFRGWAAAEVEIEGTWYRFLTTHLEPLSTGAVFQERQALELVGLLEASALPTVVAGDFNADPRDDADTYGILTDGDEFTDVWTPRGEGFTCCQLPDLENVVSDLDRRVDLILVDGDVDPGAPGLPDGVRAERFGHRPSDRTVSGLWPSDHAGVLAVVRIGTGG